jgi:hypothetical protein
MFDDLAFALSAIDWADSQFPSFKERMQIWVNENIRIAIRELEENPTHNMLIAFEQTPLPFAFSVEFGAYINVLRSALDITS